MSLLTGVGEFFGLDIGTTGLRAVQLTNNPSNKQLLRYGAEVIDQKTSSSDSKADQQKLAQSIQQLLSKSGIRTKNVAVGLPSSRVFTSVIDIERLAPADLEKTINYQADSIIPTPPAESKIDWSLLGDSPLDANKVEILITSVPNEFAEKRLDILESIGLNVIAFEPDNLALARALIRPGTSSPHLIIDVGETSTDIVITMKGAPRLTRSVPTGSEALIRAASQNLNIDTAQAQEFVFKFGLIQDKLEGQIHQAIISTVDALVTDISKSIKFFESRYQDSKLERIIMTGAASTLPEFPLYVANKFGIEVEIGNAWAGVAYPQERQNELMAVSNNFGVAVGLAERNE
ncbi:MAG TPA: type IV pilus assembly protein PilM [Candidatus Saccharimonadales bacterium]|nr:type IV pilus assembly protein PilM [Candidatus Saccharimonadales bacterium]